MNILKILVNIKKKHLTKRFMGDGERLATVQK